MGKEDFYTDPALNALPFSHYDGIDGRFNGSWRCELVGFIYARGEEIPVE